MVTKKLRSSTFQSLGARTLERGLGRLLFVGTGVAIAILGISSALPSSLGVSILKSKVAEDRTLNSADLMARSDLAAANPSGDESRAKDAEPTADNSSLIEVEVVVMKPVPTFDPRTGSLRWEKRPQKVRTYMRP